jgi:hypothetical protein
MMQGIFLIEDPISLYRCEKARLYLGFSLRVTIKDPDNNVDDADKVSASSESPSVAKAVIATTPQASVRESVLDYVNFRRQRGASANAVVKGLTTYRNKVVVAPSGSYGSIVDVIIRKAGSQIVSETGGRTLVEFWKQVYDINISPDEIPLLRVNTMHLTNKCIDLKVRCNYAYHLYSGSCILVCISNVLYVIRDSNMIKISLAYN